MHLNLSLKSLISLFLCLLMAGGILGASQAFALSPSSISVNIAPPNPTPQENVNITLSSFSANLDSVMISWFVNGKSTLSGIGKKSFSVNAGPAGSSTQVLAKILLPDGEINKNIVIRPSAMVLLWQASDSYVPPFYKGKALLVSESDVKIVAIPEIKAGGVMVSPKNMTYSWKKNYTNMPEGSGYGKSAFTFSTDYLEDTNNISVVAGTIDQKYSSEGSINTTTTSPQISFYRNDPEIGIILERALPNTHRIHGDEIVVAIPYFFSPKDLRKPEVMFSWFINDIMISRPSFQKNLMPLRVESGVTGVSKLKVQVESTDKLTGVVNKEINVEF